MKNKWRHVWHFDTFLIRSNVFSDGEEGNNKNARENVSSMRILHFVHVYGADESRRKTILYGKQEKNFPHNQKKPTPSFVRSLFLFSARSQQQKKHHRCVSYRRNLFFSIYPSLVGFALYTPACWLYERYRPWDTWERENAEKVFLVLAQWRWRFNDGKIFWGEMCVFL